MNDEETIEFTHLFEQAWALRGTPYLVDGCRAIEEWHQERLARKAERWWYLRSTRRQSLLKLLRETNPDNFKEAA